MDRSYANIPLFAGQPNLLNVIIDTPKGSRNKFAFDEEMQLFKLKHVLPEGANFPSDFGFLPNTLTEDGDPLDVLVMLDAPTFTGCLVEVRIIGALEAEQTQKGKTSRNDRLLAVSSQSHQHQEIKSLKDISEKFLEEIGHFFTSYNLVRGIDFKITNQVGPKEALKLVKLAVQNFQDKNKNQGKS